MCLCGNFHSTADNGKLALRTMTITADTSTAHHTSHVKASSILSTAIWGRKGEDKEGRGKLTRTVYSYWFLPSHVHFLAPAHL